MMNQPLQQRFDMLLNHAKDPKFSLIAMENIAAARELVDTLFSSHLLEPDEYRAYHSQVTAAKVVVHAAQLKQAQDARVWDMNLFDGRRV